MTNMENFGHRPRTFNDVIERTLRQAFAEGEGVNACIARYGETYRDVALMMKVHAILAEAGYGRAAGSRGYGRIKASADLQHEICDEAGKLDLARVQGICAEAGIDFRSTMQVARQGADAAARREVAEWRAVAQRMGLLPGGPGSHMGGL